MGHTVTDREKLIVEKIKEGTVIDRIPPGKAMKILHLLKIDEDYPYTVAIALRVPSDKMELKDVVKIKGKQLSVKELQKLSFIAKGATVNIIEDYQVKQKIELTIPSHVDEFIKCLNPNCISNMREPLLPSFDVISQEPLILCCIYCDRVIQGKNLQEQL